MLFDFVSEWVIRNRRPWSAFASGQQTTYLVENALRSFNRYLALSPILLLLPLPLRGKVVQAGARLWGGSSPKSVTKWLAHNLGTSFWRHLHCECSCVIVKEESQMLDMTSVAGLSQQRRQSTATIPMGDVAIRVINDWGRVENIAHTWILNLWLCRWVAIQIAFNYLTLCKANVIHGYQQWCARQVILYCKLIKPIHLSFSIVAWIFTFPNKEVQKLHRGVSTTKI